VPIDFSETSVQALPYAAALAQRFGAEIVLVHIIEPFSLPGDSGYLPSTLRTENKNAAQDRLLRLSREVFPRDLPTRNFVRQGQPFQEITATAASVVADMIILTTHGYTGLTHVLLGSTAELVVRHADCPVLVVRDLKSGGKRNTRTRNT
jgi:nucleotide-binding universal stress UspA family protein